MMPMMKSMMKYTLPMSGDEDMGDPETAPTEAEQQKPPNLRDAASEAPICGTCDHFAGASCSKFDNYPVKFHEGCDAHSDLAPESPEEDADTGPEMEPESEEER